MGAQQRGSIVVVVVQISVRKLLIRMMAKVVGRTACARLITVTQGRSEREVIVKGSCSR